MERIQERESQMGARYKSAEAQKQTWDGKVTQWVEQWEPPMAPTLEGQKEEVVSPEPQSQDYPVGTEAIEQEVVQSWDHRGHEVTVRDRA